ncbi:MAG: rRNA maturation RNase YbeY [Phycisphaerales bacterium]|nr:rRNA maturation RNase YbeY [Phycisphaerales bacterium]
MPRDTLRQRLIERYSVTISWQLPESWRARGLLADAARLTLASEGVRAAQLSIAVVDAPAMSRLHRRYCGVAGPTDVLTFDLSGESAEESEMLEGEVVVCAEVARREALRRLGRAARTQWLPMGRAELALYVVHGILHLCGYDDHRPADFQAMHAREDEILQYLGLGSVFAAGAGKPARL